MCEHFFYRPLAWYLTPAVWIWASCSDPSSPVECGSSSGPCCRWWFNREVMSNLEAKKPHAVFCFSWNAHSFLGPSGELWEAQDTEATHRPHGWQSQTSPPRVPPAAFWVLLAECPVQPQTHRSCEHNQMMVGSATTSVMQCEHLKQDPWASSKWSKTRAVFCFLIFIGV